VQIDLIVRGICCLRRACRAVGEHPRQIHRRAVPGARRIVCFGNGQALPSRNAKVFIGSADWMPRNFDRRVEVLVPITNPTVHRSRCWSR
jgi:polyphosphate kinase